MRPHSEATDADGVTHYVRGELRYVKRTGRRRRRGKGGHYETRDGCRWWCTNAQIREGSRAHPGKPVDCMACVADPPQAWALGYAKALIISTPSGPRMVPVFDTGTRRTITMPARRARRR